MQKSSLFDVNTNRIADVVRKRNPVFRYRSMETGHFLFEIIEDE